MSRTHPLISNNQKQGVMLMCSLVFSGVDIRSLGAESGDRAVWWRHRQRRLPGKVRLQLQQQNCQNFLHAALIVSHMYSLYPVYNRISHSSRFLSPSSQRCLTSASSWHCSAVKVLCRLSFSLMIDLSELQKEQKVDEVTCSSSSLIYSTQFLFYTQILRLNLLFVIGKFEFFSFFPSFDGEWWSLI